MRRSGLDVPMEDAEVVGGAGEDQRHDGNPHCVHDVALHRSVDEDAVADHVVVVEVTADDGGPEVNDDAGHVDDDETEQNTTAARPAIDADTLFTVG